MINCGKHIALECLVFRTHMTVFSKEGYRVLIIIVRWSLLRLAIAYILYKAFKIMVITIVEFKSQYTNVPQNSFV